MGNKFKNGHESSKALNKRMIIKFFTIVFGSVGGFILLSSVVVFALFMPSYHPNHIMDSNQGIIVNVSNREPNIISQHLSVPERTSFLIMGLDDTDAIVRADVVILGVFNRVTNQIELISIPRDTLVHLSDESLAYLSENGRRAPRQTKYSDLFAHGGRTHGPSILRRHTEEMLGISIDYTAVVNLNAFRAIVDAVGPITMEIPAGGFFYTDPLQDLVISIPGGIQQLDGAMAEGVVRYRESYGRGDLERIEMQQRFMAELFAQTLQRETLMQNALDLITTFIDYVDTDFGIGSAVRYLPFIPRLDVSSLNMVTLPGNHEMIWDPNGGLYSSGAMISYVVPDTQQIRELVDRVFFSINEVEASEEVDEESPEKPNQDNVASQNILDQELNIKVLNGGNQIGAAGRTRDMLITEGYNVVSVGDYLGSQIPSHRIVVRQQGTGNSLRRYFNNPTIQIDTNMDLNYDIIIILGTAA